MGVIMFIMLCGKPPFGGKTNKEIINNVLNGSYNMKSEVWNTVSNDAKDLIKRQGLLGFLSFDFFITCWESKLGAPPAQGCAVTISYSSSIVCHTDPCPHL